MDGPNKSPFLEEVRTTIRLRHYSIRTESCYLDWVKRFILFHNKRHPRNMAAPGVCVPFSHIWHLIEMWLPQRKIRHSMP